MVKIIVILKQNAVITDIGMFLLNSCLLNTLKKQ